MQTQTKLIKTISGQECEIYAVSHHRRLKVGKAEANIEIYENSTVVPTLGTNNIRRKITYFSVAVCPSPDMEESITDEVLQGLTAFDLSMILPDKRGIYVPFSLYGVCSAELNADRWVFEITDPETVRRLLAL